MEDPDFDQDVEALLSDAAATTKSSPDSNDELDLMWLLQLVAGFLFFLWAPKQISLW